MHERELRTVLLIQSIEETDQAGEVLASADRAQATRSAGHDGLKIREDASGGVLTPEAERFLIERSRRLCEHLEARSPVIRTVLSLVDGVSWLGRALLVLAFISGVSLSALDGSRQINILAFPLIGLIAWNLLVYVGLIVTRLRRPATGPRLFGPGWLPSLYQGWIRWRVQSLLKQSSQFNAPLAAGLRRFAAEWSVLVSPLLILRAKRLFHLSAALVPLGLIAGLYVRGIVLEYEAGWESTFLGPSQVATLLKILYGPASVISGIALPASPDGINALRWGSETGVHDAAPWIHLIAVTAAIYIIIPRLLAAFVVTSALWWSMRRMTAPVSLVPYARSVLTKAGATVEQISSVTPYAYDPSDSSISGLEHLLTASLGGQVTMDLRDIVRYGEEETFRERLSQGAARIADWNVLLMNLAATPEAENHGLVISGMRDWLLYAKSASPLLVIVDESPYVARFGNDASLESRLEERRRLWTQFVTSYGIKPCMLDLSRFIDTDAVDEHAQNAVRAALWTPGRQVEVS